MEVQRAVVMVECRIELVRPMDPAAIDDHHNVFPGFAEDRPHLVHILAQLLGIKVRHDCREDGGGAILDRSNDPEQHTAGHTAPGTILHPRWAFEGCVAFALTLTQRTCGEARAGLCATSLRGAGQSATGAFRLHRAQ